MRKVVLAALVAATAALAGVAGAVAGENNSGFKTAWPSMLKQGTKGPVLSNTTFTPLISVGDTLPGGYRFEAIPDGVALRAKGKGRVDVYVNHETSTVPFPYMPTRTEPTLSLNDFENSRVSKLSLNQHSAGILHGSSVVEPSEGYHRFCSMYLATEHEGFERELLFTNEEGIDWVNRAGGTWPATIGAPEARQIGAVVAHDVKTGKTRPIWGMGRHNHENTVPVPLPDFDGVTLLSGDDTFVSNPAQSQLYAYVADSADDVWNDRGDLWAFVADPLPDGKIVNDYYDFEFNTGMEVSGRFVRVPDFADDPAKSIAHGLRADGTDVMAADFGYPPPPNDGTWQRDPSGIGLDGPQWVLEHWGDTQDVFQFIRIEDIAYDKRPNMSNVVYLADSGRGSSGAPATGKSTNGRVWKLVLDPGDPTRVLSLSILVEGDDAAVKTLSEIHQPDNLETTANGSLLVQEDPGSSQQFSPAQQESDADRAVGARIWWVPLADPNDGKKVAAEVDQSLDERAGYDTDPADPAVIPSPAFAVSPGNLGAWESSGIVDASAVFGPGAFLATVQAHTLWVDWAPGGIDLVAPFGSPDFTNKREGGQLVLVRIPGA